MRGGAKGVDLITLLYENKKILVQIKWMRDELARDFAAPMDAKPSSKSLSGLAPERPQTS